MPRYIDADELTRHIEKQQRMWDDAYDIDQVLGDIEDFPTVRVGLKTGHWIKRPGGKYVCSNCNMDALFDNTTCMVPSRYCPSCGRWMCDPIEDLTEEKHNE